MSFSKSPSKPNSTFNRIKQRSSPRTSKIAKQTTSTVLEDWLTTHKIKLEYKAALISLGVEEPQDFMDLDDEDIEEFVTSNDLNKIQKKRIIKAYREIKYGELINSPRSSFASSPRSSFSSSIQSRSGSMSAAAGAEGEITTSDLSETIESINDHSFTIRNYLIFTNRNLSVNLEGHCKVLLGETTDRKKTPVVAKISTNINSAITLMQEYKLLEHIHNTLGTSAKELVIELIDWIENYDNNGNHVMILERGEINGDLNKIFKGQHLNTLGDISCISIAKNLLEIGSCLSTCGIVW